MEGHQKDTKGTDQGSQHADERNRSFHHSRQSQYHKNLRNLLIQQLSLHCFRVSLTLHSLCDGGELFDRLDQTGSLSENDARILFKQMVEAINYLHKNKIAHRDLKPENFLFLRKDSINLKLIDFGLAVRWENSLKDELKKKGEKKLVGTVSLLSHSPTTWLLKSWTLTMTRDAIFGAWESSSTSC